MGAVAIDSELSISPKLSIFPKMASEVSKMFFSAAFRLQDYVHVA